MWCMGQLIPDQVKQIGEGEAAYALREAWKKLYQEYPSVDSLALLWAQWALETGRGKAIHCYNFGNIKRSADEDYCMYRCNEVINGKLEWFDPPHKQTWFRAYSTAVDGAYDYIKFLSQKQRYQTAWAAVQVGNPAAFGHALKMAGYYTADEVRYTKGLVSLTSEFKRKIETIMAWQAPTPEPTPAPTPIEEERRSELPTVVPTGEEVPPTTPDLDFHPDQENVKHIEIPDMSGIAGILLKLWELLRGLL